MKKKKTVINEIELLVLFNKKWKAATKGRLPVSFCLVAEKKNNLYTHLHDSLLIVIILVLSSFTGLNLAHDRQLRLLHVTGRGELVASVSKFAHVR